MRGEALVREHQKGSVMRGEDFYHENIRKDQLLEEKHQKGSVMRGEAFEHESIRKDQL